MAHIPGAAGKFFDRFDTTTEEKREKCLPSGGGGSLKSLGAWAGRDPGVLKRSLTVTFRIIPA